MSIARTESNSSERHCVECGECATKTIVVSFSFEMPTEETISAGLCGETKTHTYKRHACTSHEATVAKATACIAEKDKARMLQIAKNDSEKIKNGVAEKRRKELTIGRAS